MWSFGVVMWEIFERKLPYHELENHQVSEFVTSGKTLTKPEKCPDEVWNVVIQTCWKMEPSSRPSFESIAKSLEKITFQKSLLYD